MTLRQSDSRFEPELRLAIGGANVHMATGFLAREKEEAKILILKTRWAHYLIAILFANVEVYQEVKRGARNGVGTTALTGLIQCKWQSVKIRVLKFPLEWFQSRYPVETTKISFSGYGAGPRASFVLSDDILASGSLRRVSRDTEREKALRVIGFPTGAEQA